MGPGCRRHAPPLYPRERAPLPQGLWTGGEKRKSLLPTGVRTPNRPSSSDGAITTPFVSIVEVKVVCFHATMAYRGCESIAPLILNLGTICRWMAYLTPVLLYPRENRRYPLISRVDGFQSHCGRFREEKHF